MKALLALIAILLPLPSHAAPEKSHIPDIPPDASGAFYRERAPLIPTLEDVNNADGLGAVMGMGTRNLEWLQHINSFRPANEKISITSKETTRGYPIDAPNEYNPEIILAEFNAIKASIPASMRTVIFENAAFTKELPVELKDYIQWAWRVDRNYQSAARWRTMGPWLGQLERRRRNDIRGYHFLSRLAGRAEKLRAFDTQPNKAELRGWLVGLCFNNGNTLTACEREVDAKISAKADLEEYYQGKRVQAAAIYDAYFAIPAFAPRREYRMEAGPNGTTRFLTPFQDPGADDVRHFLRFNIEDEWKLGDWHLEMPFVNDSSLAQIVFEEGATPNVNGLGGDTITMNASQPLTEYDAQWTIRHEFGHVLGLPDCYVEFYVSERKSIMNYQIDVDNIMCSRRGHVKQENVNELKRAYGR